MSRYLPFLYCLGPTSIPLIGSSLMRLVIELLHSPHLLHTDEHNDDFPKIAE